MTLARLFSPCIFGHAHPQWSRNAQSRAVWQCSRCLVELGPVLESPTVDGPAKAQAVILGQPTGKVTTERRRGNVAAWKVSNR